MLILYFSPVPRPEFEPGTFVLQICNYFHWAIEGQLLKKTWCYIGDNALFISSKEVKNLYFCDWTHCFRVIGLFLFEQFFIFAIKVLCLLHGTSVSNTLCSQEIIFFSIGRSVSEIWLYLYFSNFLFWRFLEKNVDAILETMIAVKNFLHFLW